MREIDWLTYKDDPSVKIDNAKIQLITIDKNGKVIPSEPSDPDCANLSILCTEIALTEHSSTRRLYQRSSRLPGLIIDVNRYCWMASEKRVCRQPGVKFRDLPWITIGDRDYLLQLAGVGL